MTKRHLLKNLRSALDPLGGFRRGARFGKWPSWASVASGPEATAPGKTDLERFFDANTEGPGLWKWRHYFDIYERHFSKFRGKPVRVLEIGVFSGGSLPMWREYFGPASQIYGLDIEPACKNYEQPGIEILIGDQADRSFWSRFRQQYGPIDVVIDDGGHEPEQQSVTMEELLPYMSPGGVFLCEDITGVDQAFAQLVYGLASTLNEFDDVTHNYADLERRMVLKPAAN